MQNEDLFFDEKDREIALLKYKIKRFKKYDEERKKYYSDALVRLGRLESYFQELEDSKSKDYKDMEISKLKKHISELNIAISRSKNPEDVKRLLEALSCDNSEIKVKYADLKKENAELKRKIESMRKNISDLVCQVKKYERDE